MSFEIQIHPNTDFQEIRLRDKSNSNSITIVTKGGLLNEWLAEGVNAIIHGNDLSRGCSVEDIANLVAITATQIK
jgi:hypothetical protein